ncbi:MAG: homocysteine S-methyltransferase family protein [Pseudomonadota bacterium]
MSITILDGSIGQELVKRLGEAPTPLWSTNVMLEDPDLVAEVHLDYFNVGAEIATLNTYPVLRDRLRANGIEDKFEALHKAAQDHAIKARDAYGGGKIASSLGPLGASYRPDLLPDSDEAIDAYAEIIAFHDDVVDLHLIETVVSLRHVEVVLKAAEGADKPVWLAVSLDDDKPSNLRSGEALADAQPLVEAHKPDAVLVNCSTPEAVTAGLPIVATWDVPFGAYANGFTKISDGFLTDNPTVDALSARADLGPEAYADFVQKWVDMGATIIGGCCEVGPDHIAELKRRFG